MRLPLLLSAIAGCTGLYLSFPDWEKSALKRKIHSDFPTVRQISTQDLAAWLEDKKRQQPILIDVRTEVEYAVSHIPNAIRVDPGADVNDLELRFRRDAPIVTYCSVGYRSSALTRDLLARGYSNAENLEGSLFQWANERRPLVRNGTRVTEVHPYSRFWGRLLNKHHRADLASVKH